RRSGSGCREASPGTGRAHPRGAEEEMAWRGIGWHDSWILRLLSLPRRHLNPSGGFGETTGVANSRPNPTGVAPRTAGVGMNLLSAFRRGVGPLGGPDGF